MIEKFRRYKLVSFLSLAAILFALGGFIWAWVALSAIGSGPFILHFNDIDGITSVGGLNMIIFMGIFGLVVTVMNGFISLEFEAKNRFFGKLVAVMTLVFAILLFIAFASILSVN